VPGQEVSGQGRRERHFLANPECTITTQNLKLPFGNLNVEK